MSTQVKPPRLKKNAQNTIDSAMELARLVLGAKQLSEAHKKGVLNYVIWAITEAKYPKHKLPLRTAAAHELICGEKRGGLLRHEHVFTRKWLVSEMLKRPERAGGMLEVFAIGCVVTKREASRLNTLAGKQGWARYRALKLRVLEVQEDGRVVSFHFPR
jgi:hypothetical protein